MTQSDTEQHRGEGNSIPPPQPLNSRIRGRKWVLTLNNFTEDEIDTLTQHVSQDGIIAILASEVGKQGTPHIQGYISYKNAVSFNSLRKLCPRGHWAKAKGSDEQNYKYCSKDGNILYNNIPVKRTLKLPLAGVELYAWQASLRDKLMKEPDERSITWIWEPHGKTGKTSFCKDWIIRNPETAIMLSGKAADIKFGIATFVKKNVLKVAFFHFTRSNEHYVSYEALEAVKDGMFFCGKYESGMVVFDTPHVVVFANFEPDERMLSHDRWDVIRISVESDMSCHGGVECHGDRSDPSLRNAGVMSTLRAVPSLQRLTLTGM